MKIYFLYFFPYVHIFPGKVDSSKQLKIAQQLKFNLPPPSNILLGERRQVNFCIDSIEEKAIKQPVPCENVL